MALKKLSAKARIAQFQPPKGAEKGVKPEGAAFKGGWDTNLFIDANNPPNRAVRRLIAKDDKKRLREKNG